MAFANQKAISLLSRFLSFGKFLLISEIDSVTGLRKNEASQILSQIRSCAALKQPGIKEALLYTTRLLPWLEDHFNSCRHSCLFRNQTSKLDLENMAYQNHQVRFHLMQLQNLRLSRNLRGFIPSYKTSLALQRLRRFPATFCLFQKPECKIGLRKIELSQILS